MIVYFIRHGETDFNKRCLIQGMSDIPLNDKGIQQAGNAAEWFEKQNITFDRVFASPLVRARKTAAIVSGRTFEEVQPDARIREMDFGVDEGKPYSLIKDLFDAPESYIPPEGAESIEELPLNLFDAVKELEADQYICDTLGKHASSKYIEAKYAEWDEYRRQITNWEIDQYLYKI